MELGFQRHKTSSRGKAQEQSHNIQASNFCFLQDSARCKTLLSVLWGSHTLLWWSWKYKRIKTCKSSQRLTSAENKTLSLWGADLPNLNKRNFIKHSETDEHFCTRYLLCHLLCNGSHKCFNKYMERLFSFTVAFVNAHVSSAEMLFCNFSFTESQQVSLCHLQQCTRGNIPLLSPVLHMHQQYKSWILNLFTHMPTDPVFTVEIWSKQQINSNSISTGKKLSGGNSDAGARLMN